MRKKAKPRRTKHPAKRQWGAAHGRVRKTCKWCRRKRHHFTPSGDTHRFHATKNNPNPFCATHRTTRIGQRYCNSNGTPKAPGLKMRPYSRQGYRGRVRGKRTYYYYKPKTKRWYE